MADDKERQIRKTAEEIEKILFDIGFEWSATPHLEKNASNKDLATQVNNVVRAYGSNEGVIHFFKHTDNSYEVRIYFK